jgi:hypothetical protein
MHLGHLNVRILASTSAPFRPTTVQMATFALTEKKRITVHFQPEPAWTEYLPPPSPLHLFLQKWQNSLPVYSILSYTICEDKCQ